MTHRPLLVALLPAFAFALACGTGEEDETPPPLLEEVSAEGDASLDLVDRSATLAAAADAVDAPAGAAIDFAGVPEGFTLGINSSEEVGTLDDSVGGRSATYEAVVHGVALAALADAATALIVLPPAAAIDIVRRGAIVEVSKNVWVATNTVSDGTNSVTGVFVVAWVGVGWLAEMRLTSSDGTWTGQPWFNGFLSVGNNVGWWDFYDPAGTLGGVVEWVADGAGNGEFAIAATSGEDAGDVLAYVFVDDSALVSYHDESRAEDAWVYAAPDKSGEVRTPDWNGGLVACWDAETAAVPYADATCPAE